MGRRIAYLGMAAAVCVALVAGISLTPGCYDVPQPECGFFCGEHAACPDDYTCNTSDNRCHLNGSPPQQCLPLIDAGPIDMPDSIGVDVMPDMPIDANMPPSVNTTSPTSGATGVGVGTAITATFSENVLNVSGTTFTLTQAGNPVPATVTYTPFGFVATLTPSSPLTFNATYTATLSSGITDQNGAPLTTTTWMFTTGGDTVAPMVTMRTPAPNATAVPLSSAVTATFDEPVTGVSSTTFTLMDGATAIPGTVTYTSATRTATFTPTGMLPPGTLLTATLTAGITDTASNALSGAPVSWTFTTIADSTAPMVTMRSPAANATMVSTGTTIEATFDEPVTNVTATTFTVMAGSAVTGTLASSMAGRVWTFTPSAPLPSTTMVTVVLTTGIMDLSGNALASADTWSFTTATDTTAPSVMSTTPASGATMVATSSTIVVDFSEPVTGVTASSFTVSSGGAVAGTLASSNGGATWTFTPSAAFVSGATVSVTLGTAIMDSAGNALAAPYMFMFTTIPDTIAPTVMSTTPAMGAAMVPTTTTIAVTFSEPVMNVNASTFTVNDGTSVAGTLASSNGGATWTFTPSAPLADNAAVTLTLTSGITDLAANPLVQVMQMFMTAPDTTAPAVQSSVPAANATMVATSSTIAVTFSEPVMNVTAASFTVNDGAAVAGALASSNGGRTWTFAPGTALTAAATVTVNLTGAITDTNGNALAPVMFTFMTQ